MGDERAAPFAEAVMRGLIVEDRYGARRDVDAILSETSQ